MCEGFGRHAVANATLIALVFLSFYKPAHKECAERGRRIDTAHPIYFAAGRSRLRVAGASRFGVAKARLVRNDGECFQTRLPQVARELVLAELFHDNARFRSGA